MKNSLIFNLIDDITIENKTNPSLKSINLEITNRCNLSCRHCYMSSVNASNPDIITLGDIKKLVEEIKTIFSNEIKISITGGEPFTRKDIFEVLKLLKEEGFSVGISTNGLLLGRKVKNLEKTVNSISISLDGLEKSHNYLRNSDSFAQALDTISQLTTSSIPNVVVKTVVYKKNIDDLEELFLLLKKNKVDCWHLIPFEPSGRGEINKKLTLSSDEYQQLCDFVDRIRHKEKKKIIIMFEEQPKTLAKIKASEWHKYRSCLAGINSLSILANGDVVSCINCNRGKNSCLW